MIIRHMSQATNQKIPFQDLMTKTRDKKPVMTMTLQISPFFVWNKNKNKEKLIINTLAVGRPHEFFQLAAEQHLSLEGGEGDGNRENVSKDNVWIEAIRILCLPENNDRHVVEFVDCSKIKLKYLPKVLTNLISFFRMYYSV